MKFAVGADHAGVGFRGKLLQYLGNNGHEVYDYGTTDEESCDYPEYAHRVAEHVAREPEWSGLLVCGSGEGMVMTANRYPGVRAALCLNETMAKKTREHNNANCLVLAERMMEYDEAKAAVDQFIETSFDGGRHRRRINKIDTPPLKVSTNPVVQSKITRLRDRTTSSQTFRELIEDVTLLLLAELCNRFPTESHYVETPIEKTEGSLLSEEFLIVPIMRAGLGMLQPVMDILENVHVAHLGLNRDEETHETEQYYQNIPDNLDNPNVIIIDPMLATGGTAQKAIEIMKSEGYEDDLSLLTIIAAPEGVNQVHEIHGDLPILTGILDEGLDENNYIIPGLGDAGDRIYGTD